jgi:C-5 cytosine-specific DNA methylase
MLTPQFMLPIHTELVVDLFAGGGGASTGIEQAIGRAVDVAINHDPEAISLHQANHPQTMHYCSDVFEVDPVAVTHGQPVGLLWASPDCKHFSKAKGGKPVSKKIRSLAWVVVKWAKAVQPRIICLENVEEFQTVLIKSRARVAKVRHSSNGSAACAISATRSNGRNYAPVTMVRQLSASAYFWWRGVTACRLSGLRRPTATQSARKPRREV